MNRNKLRFDSEALVVDYISFNISGFKNPEPIANYLSDFDFNSTLKSAEKVICILKKGHQTRIFIFSKEFLFGVIILLECRTMSMTEDTYFVFSESTKVYKCCISRCNNSGLKESFKYPSPISDCIMKLKGGELAEISDKEMEKLIESIKSKTSESRRSFNKILKIISEKIEPVITDQRFWRILSESQKPIKSELSGPSEIRSTDILGPTQNALNKQAKKRSKGSSIFADVLLTPQARRKSSSLLPMEKSRLTMVTEDSFSNGLAPSGLSVNHDSFSNSIKEIEIKTRLRRAQLLYSSERSEQYLAILINMGVNRWKEKLHAILNILVFLLKEKV